MPARDVCTLCISLMLSATTSSVAIAQNAKYDGQYKGTMTLSANNASGRSSACLGGPYTKVLSVVNSKFNFVYNSSYNFVITGTVGPDGSVSGSGTSSTGGTKLTGTIQGNIFTGEVGSALCTFSLRMTKS